MFYIFSSSFMRLKSWAILIARLSSKLSLFKNFSEAKHSKVSKTLTWNFQFFFIMARHSSKTRDINLQTLFLELCPFVTRILVKMYCCWQTSIGMTRAALVLYKNGRVVHILDFIMYICNLILYKFIVSHFSCLCIYCFLNCTVISL